MKANLIRVEEAYPWYFTRYYYKCIDCGAEYMRHQHNDRINPYCGICQRKHDTEAQRQRNITHKNKIVVEELKKLWLQIYNMDEPEHDFEGFYYCQNEVLELINKRKSELEGEK